MEWQTIESAPKDGTTVDVWLTLPSGGAGQRYPDASWDGTSWVSELEEWEIPRHFHVTHWMPLPSPPEAP